jgi:dihydroneopterin aldolase
LESIEDDNDDYSMTSDRLLTSRDSYNEGHSKFYVLFKKALRAAIQEITYAILSPKVLMLIAINKKLMQDKAIDADYEENKKYKFNYMDVFKGIEGIISSMVKNVIDEVEKEVLRVIMARITELMNNYTLQLAKEYIRNWQTALKSLLSCFSLNGNNLKANGAMEDSISAILDKVDTADLDELAGQIIPDTNPC